MNFCITTLIEILPQPGHSASQRANWPGKLSGLGIYYAAVSFKGDASVVAWQHKLPGEGFSACSQAKHVALL